MGDENEPEGRESSSPTRRAVLRNAGIGAIVVAGGAGAAGAASGDEKVFTGESGWGDWLDDWYDDKHDHGKSGCPDGLVRLAKFEFYELLFSCGFTYEKGAAGRKAIDVDYDRKDRSQNKDGERCEPIAFDWDAGDNFVHYVEASGGGETGWDAGGRSGTFTFDAENKWGKTPAISNVTFCGGVCVQVDFVKGDVIETLRPDEGTTYNQQGRLVAARWAGMEYDEDDGVVFVDEGIDLRGDVNACDVDIVEDLHFDLTDATASVTFEADGDCSDSYALVAYRAPCPARWDRNRAHQQVIADTHVVEPADIAPGRGHTLTVDLPSDPIVG